jgi:DNA polymerase-3 subunit delta
MDLKIEQLHAALQRELLPVYLIASDEHLLLEESCELIIQQAKTAGFTEKERLITERGFNWQTLNDASANMSLFGEKKLIDLRISNGKPEAKGSEAIIKYLENPSPDNLLLIRCPQLNKQTLNSKWIKTINKAGAVCVIWKVKAAQLPQWIQQRTKQNSLTIDRDAAQILAERVEGNLLAANQEIQKLALLFPQNSQISVKQIIQTVANNSRYDVFNLMEHALAGESKKALKMLRGLREERTDLTIIVWSIRNELETLLRLSEASVQKGLAQCFKEFRIWSSKQGLYTKALKRLNKQTLYSALLDLAELDKTVKGRGRISQNSSADDLCETLILKLSGCST